MKQKNWVRWYGAHAALCISIFAIAFGINQRINLNRSHIYTVEWAAYTLLEEITKVREEEGRLLFSGWGFDTDYYNEGSGCELILQDTKTGEALWPKMKKSSQTVEIAERYTDGGDYSEAVFEGEIKANQLKKDSVYEILLRYTSEYVNEDGEKQQYVRTIATDKFFYQGEMTEYNPKTFQTPEIEGSELEKELEGARLFHYFPEGIWIYYDKENLYYIADKSMIEIEEATSIYTLWYARNVRNLAEEDRERGFGSSLFYTKGNESFYSDIIHYYVWKTAIPSEKAISIHTGFYNAMEGKWLWNIRKQLGDVLDEQ